MNQLMTHNHQENISEPHFYVAPCIPSMQLNMLRQRLVQHFTKVGGNGERLVDDHVSFIGINVRMSGS